MSSEGSRARLQAGFRRLGVNPDATSFGDSLVITVDVREDAVLVDLAGWVEEFPLGADDELCRESCDLALDLVAAGLFGELRVERWLHEGRLRAVKAEVLVDGTWRALGSSRGRLGLFGRRDTTGETVRNAGTRPPPLVGHTARGLPFAPFAGSGGFYGHDETSPKEVPVDGVLDLHEFEPKDVSKLLVEYIDLCRDAGITELRVIHGKGKGVLRRTVHALLDAHPAVRAYRLGEIGSGGWGATLVDLLPFDDR